MGRFKALVCCTAMALLALTGAKAGVMNPIPGDPITIETGKLSGTLLDSGVKAYLGVPFAAPPVRELRWAAPQPVKPWKGIYNADSKITNCYIALRATTLNHYFGEIKSSEDCLYVNIWTPPGAKAGDKLILGKPLGVGIMSAALKKGALDAAGYAAMIASTTQLNTPGRALGEMDGVHAITDVTGFGLLGHLGEMLGPGVAVELDPAVIPAHAGALELLEQGFASTLAPSNAAALALLEPSGPVRLAGVASTACLQLLIDPQTCGPLLAALPEAAAQEALAELRSSGFPQAAVIGRVQACR